VTPLLPEPLDPFDLTDALGAGATWSAEAGLGSEHRVRGRLVPTVAGHEATPCDLLAADDAYPAPVTDDATRARAHQAWRHGEVHLAAYDGRLTLVVPGTRFSADLALEALRRLARALGARPQDFAALLRLTD